MKGGQMGLLDRFRGEATTRVHMLASVDAFVAGEQYDIPVGLADRFIVRGYAEGQLSRDFSDSEIHELSVNAQTVGV
jgi:hypothetical protein